MTSYREAGVDLAGADRHVERIGPAVVSTWTDRVVGGFGGFAAGVEIPSGYVRPVIMMSTDGVGTKLELARASGRWSGIGHDLVAMCVDDLAVVGARPLGFVDYMAVGSLVPNRDAAIVASIADGCSAAGIPLLGGETAEHPGVMEADAVDLAGAAAGVVERGRELTGRDVEPGNLVLGLESPNLRSNGFSLVRKVFSGVDLADRFPGEEATHAEVLLRPSVLYAPAVLGAIEHGGVTGAAHITGGGLPGNLVRPLPEGVGAAVDSSAWPVPNVFSVIAAEGGIASESMFETFNMGIGFCLIVDPAAAEDLQAVVQGHGHRSWVIGEIFAGDRRVGIRTSP